MSKRSCFPLVLIGVGGHASILTDILLEQGRKILAVVSPEGIAQRTVFSGIKQLNNDADILNFDKEEIRVVNGIGMMPKSNLKRKVNEYFLSLGYQFETIISDSALVSSYARIEVGAQILHSTIIQTGVTIGAHTIINTGALVEHDCRIGAYNHIAPRATVCGQVNTQNNVYIGANAVVIQNIQLKENVIIGAGSVVTQSLNKDKIYYPAKGIIKRYD